MRPKNSGPGSIGSATSNLSICSSNSFRAPSITLTVSSRSAPPLDTSHSGGVFTTRTLPRDAEEAGALLEINHNLLEGLGFVRGVTHAEFLKSHAAGKFYFIEVAARVGGAYISDVIEAATGINLWREWARLEIGAGKQPYEL